MADVDLTLGLQLKGINAELVKLNNGFEKLGQSGKKAGDDGQKGADKMSAAWGKATKKLAGVAAAYVSLRTAQAAFNTAQDAARTRDAVAILEAAGGSIERLRTQTRGLFSDAELAKNANLARTLGIDSQQFAELANIAGAAARATGENAEFLLQSISRGTARSSKLLLDNLGILIDTNKVREDANAILKNNSNLTEDQARQQAFINQVLEEGKGIVDDVARAGANAGETFDLAEASVKNLATAFGERLIPAVSGVLEFLTPVADELTRIIRGTELIEKKQLERAGQLSETVSSGKAGAKNILKRLTGRDFSKANLQGLTTGLTNLATGAIPRAEGITDAEFDLLISQLSEVLGRARAANEELAKLSGTVNATGIAKPKARPGRAGLTKEQQREAERRRRDEEREFERRLARDLRQNEFEQRAFSEEDIRLSDIVVGPDDVEDEIKMEEEIRRNEAEQTAQFKAELRAQEAEQIRANAADEKAAQREVAEEAAEHHRQRMEELRQIQDVTRTTIGIGVSLTQELAELVITQDKKIVEKLTASALQRVGSEFVARGSLVAAEGVALAILSHGADPAAYAAIAQGGAMVATGIGMGAAGFGIMQAVGGGNGARAANTDSVGSGAIQARGNGAASVGSSNVTQITVNYGVMGPHPDETAKAVSSAMMLANHRGFNQRTQVTR